ncbi:Uu.00g085530.m01.CDS01 [Anthostomella pinea]|uniref:Uu.00g085530.m01.CDS01 n=1 Tax=Anthostomella pinea TaxID=933095 RepID=A0AAI8YJU4_9PEZI|nr:Uu.00g085530.m01.CDS01 [Anthostomella pinea]
MFRSFVTLDVLTRRGDSRFWHLAHANGTWGTWTRISGELPIQGQPDAIGASEDSLDVLAWGQDGEMLHKKLNSSSGAWTPEHGFEVRTDTKLSGPPKTMRGAPGQNQVFACSDCNELVWKGLASSADVVLVAQAPRV